MARAAKADPAARRAVLLAARTRIDRELAQLDAEWPVGSPERAAGGLQPVSATFVPLKQAADAWGVSGPAAWKRARQLQARGLAVRLRPGGWRVAVEALGP